MVRRAHPPYFANDEAAGGCYLPDEWLLKCSLVSKQFAQEFRSFLRQSNVFHFGDNERNDRRGEILEDYPAFVQYLGPEAKDLRRLMINIESYYPPDSNHWSITDTWTSHLVEQDAVDELQKVRGLLDPRITVLMAMRYYTENDSCGKFFTYCSVSKTSESGFVAEYLDDKDVDENWDDFLDHVELAF